MQACSAFEVHKNVKYYVKSVFYVVIKSEFATTTITGSHIRCIRECTCAPNGLSQCVVGVEVSILVHMHGLHQRYATLLTNTAHAQFSSDVYS